MTKSAPNEKLREYEGLKKFYCHYWIHLAPSFPIAIDHPAHPVNSLSSLEQNFSLSRALTGLKQAFNDILEDVEDLSPQQIAAADTSLRAAGSVTLTDLVNRRAKLHKSVLRRGEIRNDTEFYLVSSLLADTSRSLSDQDVSRLNSLVLAYESSKV